MHVMLTVIRILSAWPMIARRSLANWKLLSSVVIGVVLASTIMAGTVIYFDSLRNLALEAELERRDPLDLDILTKTTKGPTTPQEYAALRDLLEARYERRLGWLFDHVDRGGKSATFFLTEPDNEQAAGDDNARGFFWFLDGIESHITILPGGEMPAMVARPRGDGDPQLIEVLIPQEAALLFDIGVGDRMSAVPHWVDVTPYASVVISGIYVRHDAEDPIWRLYDRIFDSFASGSFRSMPFLLSEESFLTTLGGSFEDMDSSYGWLLSVDSSRLNAGNSTYTLQSVLGMSLGLSGALLSYRQITELDQALADYDRRLLFSKLQMFVVLILIAVVVLYYVVTLSSFVAEQRKAEIGLLQGRGATERQILTVFVLEGATIAVLAMILAPFLAASAVALLGYTPAFSDLSGGTRLPITLTRGAFIMSAVGGLLSFAALMIPAFQMSRSTVSQGRREAARPSRLSIFQRYYLDVMLLIVGIVLFRQLSEQGALAARDLLGDVVVNQVLLAVPALILVAAAIVLLRLFPLVMTLASRALAPYLPPGIVIGLWQMARNPTHYARLSLLLILMAGLGIFTASFGGTLQRSFEERVLYESGSDIRLTRLTLNNRGPTRPLVKPYEDMDGVTAASPVLRQPGTDLSTQFGESSFEALSVDSTRFADVAWFRDDFADKPLPKLMDLIGGQQLAIGVPVPKSARSIQVRLRSDREYPTVGVAARLKDANGRYFTYGLGFLDSTDWKVYSVDLSRPRGRRAWFGFGLRPEMPFTLMSIVVGQTDTDLRLSPGAVLLDEIRTRLSNGETAVLETFEDVDGWRALRQSQEAKLDRVRPSEVSAEGDGSLMFAWAGGNANVARGVFPDANHRPVPVIATASFISDTGHSVGDVFKVSMGGRRLEVDIRDTVEFFPTLDTHNDSFLIADLDTVMSYANLGMARGEISPNEMWLATDLTGKEHADLVERISLEGPFTAGDVIDAEANLAVAKIDPLVLAGWRALLLIAFGSILVLSGLGFLVHAYVSFRDRELQFALMRTMGFTMRQLVSLMWLEQALVIVVGMALGTWMGGRLGTTIMPLLGHDDRGGQVLPPFAIDVGWSNLLLTYLAMAIIFTAIILGVIWFIQRMSLSRVLRLGDG